MTADKPQPLGLLSKLVLAIALVLIISGILWYGITFDTIERIWRQIAERPGGKLSFRFILQPAMAAIAATLHGLKDARSGRAPYFWTILWNRQKRIERLREGLNATARIILLGLVMDLIYQVLVLGTFYPNEAVIVAVMLAFAPYLIIRGLVTRVARAWHLHKTTHQS